MHKWKWKQLPRIAVKCVKSGEKWQFSPKITKLHVVDRFSALFLACGSRKRAIPHQYSTVESCVLRSHTIWHKQKIFPAAPSGAAGQKPKTPRARARRTSTRRQLPDSSRDTQDPGESPDTPGIKIRFVSRDIRWKQAFGSRETHHHFVPETSAQQRNL